MQAVSSTQPVLADMVLGQRAGLARKLALAVAGTLVLWASAKLQVPFYPVPITLQTLVVLGFGMAVGWRLAGATLALYLAEGLIGLPVFAGTPEKGLGRAYMMGPTGGYLLGYLAAAVLVGWLAERGWGRNVASTVAAMVAGNAVIYALGVAWLGTLMGWDKPVLEWGVYPFLLGDLFKIGLAAALLPGAWQVTRKLQGQGRQ